MTLSPVWLKMISYHNYWFFHPSDLGYERLKHIIDIHMGSYGYRSEFACHKNYRWLRGPKWSKKLWTRTQPVLSSRPAPNGSPSSAEIGLNSRVPKCGPISKSRKHVHMYIYICICICVCICIYIYIYIYYMYMYVYIYIYTCVCVYIYTYTHVYVYIYIYTYAHMHICTYAHMHICTYVYTYKYVYIYIYI